jgi:hypothetical protein
MGATRLIGRATFHGVPPRAMAAVPAALTPTLLLAKVAESAFVFVAVNLAA